MWHVQSMFLFCYFWNHISTWLLNIHTSGITNLQTVLLTYMIKICQLIPLNFKSRLFSFHCIETGHHYVCRHIKCEELVTSRCSMTNYGTLGEWERNVMQRSIECFWRKTVNTVGFWMKNSEVMSIRSVLVFMGWYRRFRINLARIYKPGIVWNLDIRRRRLSYRFVIDWCIDSLGFVIFWCSCLSKKMTKHGQTL